MSRLLPLAASPPYTEQAERLTATRLYIGSSFPLSLSFYHFGSKDNKALGLVPGVPLANRMLTNIYYWRNCDFFFPEGSGSLQGFPACRSLPHTPATAPETYTSKPLHSKSPRGGLSPLLDQPIVKPSPLHFTDLSCCDANSRRPSVYETPRVRPKANVS